MKKEMYEVPTVEIIAFETEDIIITSDGIGDDGNEEELMLPNFKQ